MTEFSRATASPIASLARSYGITDRTPDHGELRSAPRLFSSRRDQHVNVRGHTQGSEGQQERRALHRRVAAVEVSRAFAESLARRLPDIEVLQLDGLAAGLKRAVEGGMTVGVMRRLMRAEQSQFQAFGALVLSDSKDAKTTQLEAFGVRVLREEVTARESQAVRALLGLDAAPAPAPASRAMVRGADRPQDDKVGGRLDSLYAGAGLVASDFATAPVLKASDFITRPR